MGCCSEPEVRTEISQLATKDTPTTPEKERKPKDLLFLFLFILAMAGMGYLGYYSFNKGDPYRYLYGSDSWGNVCGRKENPVINGVSQSGMDHSERKFEFHLGLTDIKTALNPISYLQSSEKPAVLCVKSCPVELVDCEDFLAVNGYSLNNLSKEYVEKHICTMMYGTILAHKNILNRCIPSRLIQLGAGVVERSEELINSSSGNNSDQEQPLAVSLAKHAITSLLKYHRDIIYLTLLTNVFCLIVVLLLQFFTKFAIVLCIIIGGVGSILFTANMWYNYALMRGFVTDEQFNESLKVIAPAGENLLNFIDEHSDSNVSDNLNLISVDRVYDVLAFDNLRQAEYLLPWSILSTIFSVILILILVKISKSIFLVVNIYQEACIAITKMPNLMLEPIKAMVAYFNVLSYFFIIGAFILTIQNPVVDQRGFVIYSQGNSSLVPTLFLTHIFGCLWLMAFVSGCLQMVLAGAVSSWFFGKGAKRTTNKEAPKEGLQVRCKTNSHTARATVDLLFYHLGTVAFGSMIIAIVQTARIALEYVQHQLKGKESKLAQNLLKALRCCLMCFERFIKFINKNAYICSAMYGYGFFHSAKKGFTLIINNAQHAMALSCVGSICNFLGKIAVVVLTALTSILYFVYYKIGKDALLSEYFVPLATICLGSYIIAHCYFTVYQVAIDTIFLCFCDDQERNNGEDRPYYSSVGLQKYMNDSLKKKPKEPEPSNKAPEESARCSNSYPFIPIPKIQKRQESPAFNWSVSKDGSGRKKTKNICADKFWIESEDSNVSSFSHKQAPCQTQNLNGKKSLKDKFRTFTKSKKIAPMQRNSIIPKTDPLTNESYQRLNDVKISKQRTPTPFPEPREYYRRPLPVKLDPIIPTPKQLEIPQIFIPGRTFNYYEDEDLLSIVSLSSSEKTINSRACEFATPKTFSKTSSLSSGKKSVSLSTLRSWDPEDGMLIRYDSKPHLQG